MLEEHVLQLNADQRGSVMLSDSLLLPENGFVAGSFDDQFVEFLLGKLFA